MDTRAWWRSFYWRIGASFVVFLFGVTVTQGAIFLVPAPAGERR